MSDSLVYVFGCCVFCQGGDDGDSLTDEKFCGKKENVVTWHKGHKAHITTQTDCTLTR